MDVCDDWLEKRILKTKLEIEVIENPSFLNSKEDLKVYFEGKKNYHQTDSIADKAFGLFLDAARAQFFYDGNKRTGQFMMSGVLMSHEFAPVVIFADTQHEYNQRMLAFYETGNKLDMMDFLREQYQRIYQNFAD